MLSVIMELQNRPRQLHKKIMKLIMDRNNTMESDGRNKASPTWVDGGEALTQHLLVEGYPVGWRAPKLAMYEGVTNPEDHLHSFRTGTY